MSNVLRLLIAATLIVFALLFGMLIYAVANSPSCAETGGKLEFMYFQHIMINGMTHLIPIYECKHA